METTRQMRYDLNQMHYKYAIERENRFKGLGLVNSAPEDLWTEANNIAQGAANKTIPKEKKSKEAKWSI